MNYLYFEKEIKILDHDKQVGKVYGKMGYKDLYLILNIEIAEKYLDLSQEIGCAFIN